MLRALQGGPIIPEPATDDFARFQAAAQLVVSGDAADIYEPSVLPAKVGDNVGTYDKDPLAFGHPPFLPLYFLPFVPLPFVPAYLIFIVLGWLILALAIKRVGIDRSWAAAGLVVLTAPGVATIQLGQTGFWVSALLLAIFLALRSRRLFVAGALLSLLAFKAAYVVGIGVWRLFQPRRYGRALVGAACSVFVLVLMGIAVPGGWASHLNLLNHDLDTFVVNVALSGRSFLEMWLGIMPGSSIAIYMWLATSVAAVAAFWRALPRFGARLEPAFALAVAVGMLIAPRTGWYDWVLLVVPGVVLWTGYPELRDRWAAAGAWLIVIALLSRPLVRLTDVLIGVHVQIAPVILAMVGWWVARPMPSSDDPDEPSGGGERIVEGAAGAAAHSVRA